MFNLHISTRECDGYISVALRGELDLANADDAATALLAAVCRKPLIVVDLAGLTFIGASGVTALLRARRDARNAGGDLYLCAPQAQARKILGIIRLVDAFSVHATAAEAADHAGRFRGTVAPVPLQSRALG
jgi:anti-sigma B factor antagonist